jgi:FOG: FHA domain
MDGNSTSLRLPMCITIFYENSPPEKFVLNNFNKQVIKLGRRTDNDIIAKSPIVSGNHLEFLLLEGRCYVRDLNSTNGTVVNGRRITSMGLADGDVLTIWGGNSNRQDTIAIVFSIEENYLTWKRADVSGQGEVIIGRDKSCGIVLNHVSVSRFHSRIICDGNNCFIEDNGSTNGVVVNNKKLIGRRKLGNMDVIHIVNFKFIYINGQLYYTSAESSGISLEAAGISKNSKGQEW